MEPTLSEEQLLLATAKSLAFVPLSVGLLMVTPVFPVLLIVMICEALVLFRFCGLKIRDDGLTDTVVDGVCPVPLRLTDCGEPVALSVIVAAAVRVPAAVGENVTYTEHELLTASEEPQLLLEILKSPALVPVIAMEVKLIAVVPVLVMVNGWLELVVPVFWAPKVSLLTLTVRVVVAAWPLPLRTTVCGELAVLS